MNKVKTMDDGFFIFNSLVEWNFIYTEAVNKRKLILRYYINFPIASPVVTHRERA